MLQLQKKATDSVVIDMLHAKPELLTENEQLPTVTFDIYTHFCWLADFLSARPLPTTGFGFYSWWSESYHV